MNKPKKTVVLGLSGGVDSAVSAILLKKRGFRVIGAFMKNFSDTKNPFTGQCAYLEEKNMAQRIADKLKIRLVIFDFEKNYKRDVINPMYKSYKFGLTPNPDISCNTIIKFPLFWKEAEKLKADYMAMGHYAKIKKTPSGFELLQGRDSKKDQSYFLAELSQKDLSHTLFPLGGLTKEEVRFIAKKNNLPNWNKKSTRGICFVGKTDMKSFLEKKLKNNPGKVYDEFGNLLGTHPGAHYFTIGQRIGEHLGIIVKKPRGLESERFYIAKKINNKLIIAHESSPLLKTSSFKLKRVHLINPKEKIPQNIYVRIRHLGRLYPAHIKNLKITLKKPVFGIAPGQFAVLYNNKKVIGSGEIRLK